MSEQLRIYKYYKGKARLNRNQLFRPPENLNVDKDLTIAPYKRSTYVLGELKELNFYGQYDRSTNTFSELLYTVSYDYLRDSDSYYAITITTNVFWYDIEGNSYSPPEIKPIEIVDDSDRHDEIVARRNAIINKNLVPIATAANIRDRMLELFKKYNSQSQEFINSGTATFYNAIATDPSPWLDRVAEEQIPRPLILAHLRVAIDPLEVPNLVEPIDTSA